MSEHVLEPMSVTFKGRYSASTPWIVIRGADHDEIADRIIATFGPVDHDNFPELVLRTQCEYEAMELLLLGKPEENTTMQPNHAAPATGRGAPAHTCPHGPRVLKSSRPGATTTWSAWMCGLPKGSPGTCKPVDATTGKEWG